MLEWRPFDYHSLEELQQDIREAGVNLPISENFNAFKKPLEIYGHTLKNRLSIQPLEGFDAGEDGTPSDLTFRRYRRFAAGGAGHPFCPEPHGVFTHRRTFFRPGLGADRQANGRRLHPPY